MRRIYLIDCPGVVYPSKETDTEKVLKGVVRVELVQNPEDYISTVLERVRSEYLRKTYKIEEWTDHIDFLEKLARKSGKLLKKGEPDVQIVARMVLNDWQRGKLPFYVAPPGFEEPLSKPEATENDPVNSDKATNIEMEEQENESVPSKDSTKVQLNVLQDFRKIRVGLSYTGEDIKDIQYSQSELEQLNNSDNEENNDSPSPNMDNTTETLSGSQIDLKENFDKQNDQEITANIANESSENNTNEKEISNVENENNADNSDNEIKIPIEKDTLMQSVFDTIEENYDSSDSEMQDLKAFTSSGTFIVSSKKEKQYNANNKGLTSKQRRAIERANKRKKVGSNFYEVTNVKNRNRNRKIPKIKRK